MIQRTTIYPGVYLTCIQDRRFKQNCVSIQDLREMRRGESGKNALIPSVLLRGCKSAPDLRQITLRLDDLYGASVSPISRRAGDYQASGFYVSLMDILLPDTNGWGIGAGKDAGLRHRAAL